MVSDNYNTRKGINKYSRMKLLIPLPDPSSWTQTSPFQVNPSKFIYFMFCGVEYPFWSVLVTCPSCAPSQFLFLTSSLVEHQKKKKSSLSWDKHNSAKPQTSVCYHHSHHISKTQQWSSHWEEIISNPDDAVLDQFCEEEAKEWALYPGGIQEQRCTCNQRFPIS